MGAQRALYLNALGAAQAGAGTKTAPARADELSPTSCGGGGPALARGQISGCPGAKSTGRCW
eukprot:2378761-Pyramimonas_sp.AAC.1